MSPNRFLLGTQYTTATIVVTPNAGGSTPTTALTFYDPRCRTSINLNQPRSRCLEYFTTMLPSTRFRHNSIIIFKLQIQCAIRQIDFIKSFTSYLQTMTQRGEFTSGSDMSQIRSATSYRATTSEESVQNSNVMETPSIDEDEEYHDSTVSSIQSDFLTPPLTISGRGALISGMAVPSIDSDDEIEYEENDVESGPEPPDSDYASHAPPKVFQKTLQPKQSTNLMAMATDSYMKRRSVTESSDAPDQTNIEYSLRDREKPFRTRKFWCVLISVSCIFIGAIIAISMTVSGKETLSAQQQEISEIALSISGQQSIDDDYSPQRKAYMWIVYEDKRFQNENVPLDRDAVTQRYVLSVFYYATNGPLWAANNWLSGSECTDAWTGIKCDSHDRVLSLLFGESIV